MKHHPLLDIELIQKSAITSALGDLHYVESLSSTNKQARSLISEGFNPPFIVIAEEQTGGKGRMSRTWFSPHSRGIWMSIVFPAIDSPLNAGHYNFLLSLAVADGIYAQTDLSVEFKWPNDILIGQRKICGILSECVSQKNSQYLMITGTGININISGDEFSEEICDSATSTLIESGEFADRSELVCSILNRLSSYYDRWKNDGIESIISSWKKRCSTIGQDIKVDTGKTKISGRAIDVNLDGSLKLRETNGTLRDVFAGDINVPFNRQGSK